MVSFPISKVYYKLNFKNIMKHFIQGLQLGNTINFNVDGRSYKKSCPTEETADAFFDALIAAKDDPTDEMVEELLSHLNQSMRTAKENGLEYDIETGDVYLKGFNTPIPEMLVKTIEKYHEKGRDMINIMHAVPPSGRNRGVFYASPAISAMLDHAAVEKHNAALGMKQVFGEEVLSFRGRPIRECHGILETESQVT